MTVQDRRIEDCETFLVLGVDVCLIIDEELDNVDSAVLSGIVQWCPAKLICHLHVSSIVHELLHQIHLSKPSNREQKRFAEMNSRTVGIQSVTMVSNLLLVAVSE